MTPDIQNILNKAYSYCNAGNVKLSTLGRIIVNDGKFFPRLERGGDCNTDTVKKVSDWFKDNISKKPNGHKSRVSGKIKNKK